MELFLLFLQRLHAQLQVKCRLLRKLLEPRRFPGLLQIEQLRLQRGPRLGFAACDGGLLRLALIMLRLRLKLARLRFHHALLR
ncbi:hypothetical protein D3C85_1783250 [compost metagenome]